MSTSLECRVKVAQKNSIRKQGLSSGQHTSGHQTALHGSLLSNIGREEPEAQPAEQLERILQYAR